jgi:hypothetical protein
MAYKINVAKAGKWVTNGKESYLQYGYFSLSIRFILNKYINPIQNW